MSVESEPTVSEPRSVVPGSMREPVPGAEFVRPADPTAPVDVVVVLRRAVDEPGAPADPADVARVEEFAREYDCAVSGVDLAARTVGFAGTVAQMEQAFGVDLGIYRVGDLTYRGRVGDVTVPVELAGVVVAVLGLDDRPQAEPHFVTAQATNISYPPQDVGKRYGFPADRTGAGQTVAIIELGGGFRQTDLTTYFGDQGLHSPTVTAVSVDGARNAPGDPADAEVMLDIEVVGAIAQDAAIVVYFAPNTDRGFYDGIAAAIHDTARAPSVISISWGQAESGWTAQAMNAFDALFADAGAAGIPVYAAAGDDGANDRVDDGAFHVDFPASSPNVVGCGGTRLTDADETVWSALDAGRGATGGGVSQQFGPPGYQRDAGVPDNPAGQPGRGVPDVAGNADPGTGYRVRVNGQNTVIGGTSAVAPLWSGLTALANEGRTQPPGDPHPRLYAAPGALRDIVTGNNGGYEAGPGWDRGGPRALTRGSRSVTPQPGGTRRPPRVRPAAGVVGACAQSGNESRRRRRWQRPSSSGPSCRPSPRPPRTCHCGPCPPPRPHSTTTTTSS
jgi:kumamolisin